MRHRLKGIAKQVDQNLLDLDPVDQHQIELRVQTEAKLHILLAGARQTERAGLLNQLRKALDAFFRFAARDKIAKPANDLAGAERLLGSAVHGIFDLGRIGVVTGRQEPARAVHIIADGGKRLVKLVRQRGGHLTHRAQAGNVNQFGLQFLQSRLGLLVLGKVVRESGEVGLAAGLHLADRQMHRKGRSIPALASHDSADTDDVPFARGSIAREIAVMTRPVRIGHQFADVLADRLLLGIAEQTLGRRAEKLHHAVAVDYDHGVGHGVEDGPKVALARSQRFLEPLLLADVESDPAEVKGNAGFILDQASAHANPLTGRRTHLEGKIEIAACLDNPFYFPLGALAIPGLQQGDKQLVGDGLVAGDAEQTSRGVGQLQGLRRKIEIPGSDAESLDSKPEMLLAGSVIQWRSSYMGHTLPALAI